MNECENCSSDQNPESEFTCETCGVQVCSECMSESQDGTGKTFCDDCYDE